MLSTMRLALLDLETTGASAERDEITEVAVVSVVQREEEHWQSLVKVRAEIPAFIQRLTGINAEMLATAPTFEQLAPSLFERLEDAVLVAHNARFDAGFLTQSFRRLGVEYRPKSLCTLKLARRLYPHWSKHGLDALCANIGYQRDCSHRAMADVLAMKAFLEYAIAEHGEQRVMAEAMAQLQTPALPPAITQRDIQAIPERAGVYRFYADDDSLLYLGSSVSMRSGVVSYFNGDRRDNQSVKIARKLRRIEVTETAGRFGAQLLEQAQIEQLQPRYHRPLGRQQCLARLEADEQGYFQLRYVSVDDNFVADEQVLLFKHRKQAQRILQKAVRELRLCPARLGLENGGNCPACQQGRCAGACCGEQPAEEFNALLSDRLVSQRLEAWPHSGPVLIVERRVRRCDWHLVDRWRYYGSFSGRRPGRLRCAERLAVVPPFDCEHYRLLLSFRDSLEWLPLIPPKR